MRKASEIVSRIIHTFQSSNNGVVGRLVKGSTWILLGTVLAKCLVFVATILVARILPKEVYGQLGIIRSTIQLFVALSGFGIGATATRFIAHYRKADTSRVGNVYLVANIFVGTMAVVACGALWLFSDTLATDRLHNPAMAYELRIASVILFFTLVNGAQTGTLSGFEDFRRISQCTILMGVAEIFLLCAGAYFFGLGGAVVGFGLTYAVAWIYNSIGIRRHLRGLHISIRQEIRRLRWSDFRIIYSFSLPIAATSWIQMLTYWWMKTQVVNDAGFENMANYDVAEQWKALILMIPTTLSSVMLPLLSNVYGHTSDRRRAIRANVAINLSLTGSLSLVCILFGQWFLSLYGPNYCNPWPLYILVVSTMFDCISNIGGTILSASNRPAYGIISNLVWATTLFVGYHLFSTHVAAYEDGLALSYGSAAALQMCAMLVILKIKKLV